MATERPDPRLASISVRTRGETTLGSMLTVEDYRDEARRKLPKLVFDYVDGGAESESTVQGEPTGIRIGDASTSRRNGPGRNRHRRLGSWKRTLDAGHPRPVWLSWSDSLDRGHRR